MMRLIELWFYVPLDTKLVISEKTFPKPISWLGTEKISVTQQKHTLANQKKCTTAQTHTHNRFTALFPGPPGWANTRREPLTLWWRED